MKKRRILCYILIGIFIFGIQTVSANETSTEVERDISIQAKFTNILTFINDFELSSSGKASISSTMAAKNCDEIRIKIYLQQYKDGRWLTIKSWDEKKQGTMYSMSKSWYVPVR